jgi:hypothetical protein
MAIWNQKLQQIFTDNQELVKADVPQSWKTNNLSKTEFAKTIDEVYASLGGIGDWSTINIPTIDLWVGDYLLVTDSELAFNRYRGATLKSDIYTNFKGIDMDSYQRYCRQFEPECKKAGTRKAIWTSKESETHFGPAGKQGDYYENGSPGWKLTAMKAMLMDISAMANNSKLLRVSIYTNIMLGGELLRFDKILMTSNTDYDNAVYAFLKRAMENID